MAAILCAQMLNEPGALAGALVALADAGVHVSTVDAESMGELGVARFVVDQPQRAMEVLAAVGHPTQLLDAVRLELAGGPALPAEACRRLAAAGINIRHATGAAREEHSELTLLVDHPLRARTVLQGMLP